MLYHRALYRLVVALRQQPNEATQAVVTETWTRLILTYARHRRLFTLRVEDAETAGGEWDEVLRNERINRTSPDPYIRFKAGLRFYLARCSGRLLPEHLSFILSSMVSKDIATYEPPKQTRSVLLYWRLPEEWAEVLHEWVRTLPLMLPPYLPPVLSVKHCRQQATTTGHLNTILTFYEIIEPPVESPLTGLPVPLLRKAIAVLAKGGRAQLISISDGEGVRFFAGGGK